MESRQGILGGKRMKNKKSLQSRRHIDPIMPAVFRYRFLITVFLLATVLFVGGASAEVSVDSQDSLIHAVTTDNTIINITANFELSENITIDKNITIMSDNSFDLTANNSNRLFYVTPSGNLTLGNGVTLTNGSAELGGAVYVDDGTFTMNGGTISGNNASGNGGGVYVNESGTFTMNGGNIFNNSGTFGGAVYVNNGGTFTMNGGNIFNNSGIFGGAVYVNNGSTFNMNGGTISGNTTIVSHLQTSGGGVYVSSSTFNMNGGTISNNTATYDGGGVYVYSGTFTMTGDSLISDNNAYSGGGVFVYFVYNSMFNMTGEPSQVTMQILAAG